MNNWIYDKRNNIYLFKDGGNISIKENFYKLAIPIIQDELYKTYNIKDKEAVHLILGSMALESSHGTSKNALNLFNFGGIGGGRKNADGTTNWTKFDSFESGVRHLVKHIVDTFHGFENGYDPRQYIHTLKKYGYFQEPEEVYWGDDNYGWWGTYNGKTVKSYLNKYYKEIEDQPTKTSFQFTTPQLNVPQSEYLKFFPPMLDFNQLINKYGKSND